MREAIQNINFQLNSRKQAGFMLSRDWLKLLDVKVSNIILSIILYYFLYLLWHLHPFAKVRVKFQIVSD